MSDYYQLLSISRKAALDLGTLRLAYLKQARKWHPDKHLDNKEVAEEKFKEINNAYNTLSNKTKKSIYDAELSNQTEPSQQNTADYSQYQNSLLKPEQLLPEEDIPPSPWLEQFIQTPSSQQISKLIEETSTLCTSNDVSSIYDRVLLLHDVRNFFKIEKKLSKKFDNKIAHLEKQLSQRLVELKLKNILLFQDYIQAYFENVTDLKENFEVEISPYSSDHLFVIHFILENKKTSAIQFKRPIDVQNYIKSLEKGYKNAAQLLIQDSFIQEHTSANRFSSSIIFVLKSSFFKQDLQLKPISKNSQHEDWKNSFLDFIESRAQTESSLQGKKIAAAKAAVDYLSGRIGSLDSEHAKILEQGELEELAAPFLKLVREQEAHVFPFDKQTSKPKIRWNPFSHISSPKILHSSLKRRIKDTFKLFCHFEFADEDSKIKMALLDYIIPIAPLSMSLIASAMSTTTRWDHSGKKLGVILLTTATVLILYPIWIAAYAVKFSIAALITLVASPFIAITHLCLKPTVDNLAKQIEQLEIHEVQKDGTEKTISAEELTSYTKLGKMLINPLIKIQGEDNKCHYSLVQKNGVNADSHKEPGDLVLGLYEPAGKLYGVVELTSNNFQAIKALIRTNTGHVVENLEENLLAEVLNKIKP